MWEASSSPTSTAAKPGCTPSSTRAMTRCATSDRIWPAMALPSMIDAVTAGILLGPSQSENGRPTRSVPEVPAAGDDDRDATRLRRRHPGLGGHLDGVGEREERVARHRRALGPVPGLSNGDP